MHPPALILSQDILDAIIEHAREAKPEEVCGLLRGRDHKAFELIRTRNVAEDRVDNYDVDPKSLLLQFQFEEAGDEMVAIYHSHPVSEAYPSATDAWSAHYPESYYVICSLENDEAPVVRAFRLAARFPEFDIDRLRQEIDFTEARPDLYGYYQAREMDLPDPLNEWLDMDPPFYIVFNTTKDGTVEEYRVVPVREHPVQIGS